MKKLVLLSVVVAALRISAMAQSSAPFVVTELGGGRGPLGAVEIHGLSAGPFNPALWEKNQLHWVPDVRMPVLAPRMGGVFRNIYAPSAIEDGDGWRLFYAAYDGIDSGNDRVYSASTPDFIDFDNRQTIIHNGVFRHVSNVNVQKLEDGSLQMIATCWPDRNERNKPIHFHSPDHSCPT